MISHVNACMTGIADCMVVALEGTEIDFAGIEVAEDAVAGVQGIHTDMKRAVEAEGTAIWTA